MSWLLLTILSAVLYAVSTIIQRRLMKDDDSDPVAFMVVFQLLVTALIGIYFLAFGVHLPNISKVWPNLILNGILIALGEVAIFKALKLIEASESTIIGTSSAFWSLVVAAIFLGEKITFNKLLGVSLIVLGVFMVTMKKKRGLKGFHKGHLYALFSAAILGSAFINESYIVGQIGVMQNLIIGFCLPGLFVLLLKPKSVRKMKALLIPKNMIRMASFSVFYLLGAVAIFSAYRAGGEASKVYAVGKLEIVFTVVLAAIFLKERDQLGKKILGMVAALGGMLLLR